MPFSYSQLSTYRTCPKQYEFSSIKKIPRQISAGESFGSSVHNALKKWGELELKAAVKPIESGQLTLFTEEPAESPSLSVDVLIDLWHTSFITEGYDSKTDADSARQKGEQIMQQFFAWWSTQERRVVSIESGFKWDSPDLFTVSGRFDRIEETATGLRIIDFKTGTQRDQQSVDEDLQLSIYALAAQSLFQKPCSELVLLFLKPDGVFPVVTTRSQQQLTKAMAEMSDLVEGIDTDQFQATPSQPVCTRCPFRGICRDAEV